MCCVHLNSQQDMDISSGLATDKITAVYYIYIIYSVT